MINGLADKLKTLRKNNNLTRKQVSELLGISVSNMAHYEAGERVPSIKNLIKLASLYKVSVDYLLGCDNNSANMLSLNGLTPKQIKTVKSVVECFHGINK